MLEMRQPGQFRGHVAISGHHLSKPVSLYKSLHHAKPFIAGAPNASRRPIFPKQTQLQNNTLAIHVHMPMLSFAGKREDGPSCTELLPARCAGGDGAAGEGTMLGLMPSRARVPPIPTTVDNQNPVFDRSIRYHNTGFARANVSETCSVDCHGSFL